MGFNGSGTFVRLRNWVADAAANIKIRADLHDSEDDGFAAGLSNCITKDGQTTITQNIPFNGKRITGLADAVNPQDAATKTQSVMKAGDTMSGPLAVGVTMPTPIAPASICSTNISAYTFAFNCHHDGTNWVADAGAGIGKGLIGFHSDGRMMLMASNPAGAIGSVIDSGIKFSVDHNGNAAAIGSLTVGTTATISGPLFSTSLTTTGAIVSGASVSFGSSNYVAYYNAPYSNLQMWPTYIIRTNTSTGDIEFVLNNSIWSKWNFGGAFIHSGAASKPGGGPWADSSDERIKTIKGDYEPGLDEILQLQPKRFTYKGNETNEPPAHLAGLKDENNKVIDRSADPVEVPYPNSPHFQAAKDEIEFTGLIAQDVEAVFPEMVKQREAYIDGEQVSDLRDLDTTPLLFAVVNSCRQLKELNDSLVSRVDALETRIAALEA